MNTKEKLQAIVRETPLRERIEKVRRIIGKLCAEGRCQKMSIPVQADDEDFFISTTMSDCLALLNTTPTPAPSISNEEQLKNHLAAVWAAGLRKDLQASLDAQTPILTAYRALAEDNAELRDIITRYHPSDEQVLIERDQLKETIARMAQILADHSGDANNMVPTEQKEQP